MNGPFTSRRDLFTRLGAGAAAMAASSLLPRGAFADDLERRVRTPEMTEGPFYPDRLPLDTDNDLIVVNDALSEATGEITHLGGKILDSRGDPVRNATIEIWQVDSHGSYIHTDGMNGDKRDDHFQGYGRFLTSSSGEYYFRTIKPVPYPGRTPHIHVKVRVKGKERLTTQCFVKGHPQNRRDGILNEIRDAKQRESVILDYAPLKGSRAGELTARFDIVLGYTPSLDDQAPAADPKSFR
jgi:protocatechuate 3,4-dioxygenase beta subunit